MKQTFILQLMNQTDHYPKEKIKKSNQINERCIRWENNGKFCRIETKTYSYLTDDNDGNKNAKGTKRFVIKKT